MTNEEKDKKLKILNDIGAFSILVFTVPTFLFLALFPQFNMHFPSVLCDFALLLAITLLCMIYYKEKHEIKL